MSAPLLVVDSLRVELPIDGGLAPVLRDVSFAITRNESLGIVGESGSGKSMTVRAIDRLLPHGAQVSGRIEFTDGAATDVMSLDKRGLAAYRMRVAMVFQDPRAHINPLRTVGQFLTEAVVTNKVMDRKTAQQRAARLLDEVGVDRAEARMKQYPFELSGGLLQRVMIASALLTEPALLLADEPTTALDVTTQSEVMAIIDEIRRERGMALIFITHDLDLAAAVCDRTAVMYAGSLVEVNASAALHEHPMHPYTAALAEARPSMHSRAQRLTVIPGTAMSALNAPAEGCAFAPRCTHAEAGCLTGTLELREVHGALTRCVRAEEIFGGDGGR